MTDSSNQLLLCRWLIYQNISFDIVTSLHISGQPPCLLGWLIYDLSSQISVFYYIHFTCYVYLAWGKFDAKLHSGLRLLKVNGNENIVWVRSGFGFFSILTTLYWRTTGSVIVHHVMRRRLFWGFRDSRQCLGRKCFGFIFLI